MFCTKCGSELSEKSKFCGQCGAQADVPADAAPMGSADAQVSSEASSGELSYPSPNVLQTGGMLKWVYEYSLWKNPTIFFSMWKILAISSGIMGLFMFFITLEDGFTEALRASLMVFGIVAGTVTGLLLLAYPLYSIMNGGKYCVVFEMDEKGVKHIQLDKQFKKARILGIITALAGAAAGSPAVAGAGLLSASKNIQSTDFSKVRLVSVKERRHVIYLNESLGLNQVYAEPEDFAFVRDYILSHVSGKAKIKR